MLTAWLVCFEPVFGVNVIRLHYGVELGYGGIGERAVAGQNPGELEVADAEYTGTGVDQGVVIIVSVQYPVVTVWRRCNV